MRSRGLSVHRAPSDGSCTVITNTEEKSSVSSPRPTSNFLTPNMITSRRLNSFTSTFQNNNNNSNNNNNNNNGDNNNNDNADSSRNSKKLGQSLDGNGPTRSSTPRERQFTTSLVLPSNVKGPNRSWISPAGDRSSKLECFEWGKGSEALKTATNIQREKHITDINMWISCLCTIRRWMFVYVG